MAEALYAEFVNTRISPIVSNLTPVLAHEAVGECETMVGFCEPAPGVPWYCDPDSN